MRAAWIAVGLTALALPCRGADGGKPAAPPAAPVSLPESVTGAPGSTLEGPFVHRNVALYMVRGAAGDGTDYITLDEGLAKRVVSVREQGGGAGSGPRVNALDVRNMSSRWLYIQAGDIVKGGKQDRTIATDLSLAPRSVAPAVEAFCVEHGRWTSGDAFAQNTALVSGNALKLSIQLEGSQERVWAEVERIEQVVVKGGEGDLYLPLIPLDLASGFWKGKGGIPSQPAPAPLPTPGHGLSSTGTYNAILENRGMQELCKDYTKTLQAPMTKDRDVIGVVVAVNGKVRAADLYGSSALFGRMSRKLLDSYVLEAALARNGALSSAPQAREVAAFLSEATRGSSRATVLAGTVNRQTREGSKAVLFEYSLAGGDGGRAAVFHRSYVAK